MNRRQPRNKESFMRNLLYAATALGGFILPLAANATLVSTVSSTGGALTAGCNTTTATGSLNATCTGGGFTDISLTASGPPLLPAPDLSATTLTVTTGPLVATTTLTVDIASSGFSFPGGPVSALLTVNNLVGAGTGPFVLSAVTPVGTETFTFTGSGSDTVGPVNLGAFTNDSANFVLTFGASALPQSVDATIEIQGVPAPEPMSLALMGVGLLGLGMVRATRRS
jgi:hypothetical protein